MNELFLGCIFLWSLPWVPTDLAFCNGQLLQIAENEDLFKLMGTIYGGDGINTFALPDLRSRVPIGTVMNTTPALTPVNLAVTGGTENAQLIEHSHTVTSLKIPFTTNSKMLVSSQPATLSTPTFGCSIAAPLSSDGEINPTFTPALGFNSIIQPDEMNPLSGINFSASVNSGNVAISSTGNAINGNYGNMQPFLGLNYVIYIGLQSQPSL